MDSSCNSSMLHQMAWLAKRHVGTEISAMVVIVPKCQVGQAGAYSFLEENSAQKTRRNARRPLWWTLRTSNECASKVVLIVVKTPWRLHYGINSINVRWKKIYAETIGGDCWNKWGFPLLDCRHSWACHLSVIPSSCSASLRIDNGPLLFLYHLCSVT